MNAKEFIRDLEDRAVTARREGIEQGLQPLLHQIAHKLGRPVSEEECAIIHSRFNTLGPDRLGEAVLDLPPSALGTWLADPAAR